MLGQPTDKTVLSFPRTRQSLVSAAAHRMLHDSDVVETDARRFAERDGESWDRLDPMVQSRYRLAAAFALRFLQSSWTEVAYAKAAQTAIDKMQEILDFEVWRREKGGLDIPASETQLRYDLATRAIVNRFLFVLSGQHPLEDDELLAVEQAFARDSERT